MSNQGIDTSGLQEAAKQKASEVVEQAEQVGDSIQDRVAEETDIRSTQAGEQVGALGEAMRGASEQLRSQGNDIPAALTEQVAVRAERLGRYCVRRMAARSWRTSKGSPVRSRGRWRRSDSRRGSCSRGC
jgi:hypothetical protein